MSISPPSAGSRRTFVVQVHEQGRTTVEDVQTQERVGVASMAGAADQIETWLSSGGRPPQEEPNTDKESP